MVTAWLFLGVVAVVAIQRLAELRLSARNEAALKARGAIEHGADHMKWMRLLHTAWLVAMPLEVFLLNRPFFWPMALFAGIAVIAGQLLRYAAIERLGPRWTVKILVLPGATPVTGGIFRHVRHPNYLGVILEIAFLPLLHSAWLTAVTFSILNGLLLRTRIRAEEAALREANGYGAFTEIPRLVPGVRR